MPDSVALLAAAGIFVFAIVAGLPLYLGILGSALYLDLVLIRVPLAAVVTGLYESIFKTSLMAVPFFVLAGTVMDMSGMGEVLVQVFMRPLRRLRGGLAVGCLLANAFFGAISGSSMAAVATFSKVAYPALRREYGERMALGLITATGALDSIIPPSIPMILYGVVTETSIPELFLGGFGPGLVIVLIVGAYLLWTARACRPGLPETPIEPASGGTGSRPVLPVLVIPLLTLGGIYSGLFTPTEAGAVTAVYCVFIATVVYRAVSVRQLVESVTVTARVTGQVFILAATSTVLAQAVTMAQIPQLVTHDFAGLSPVTFLIFVNVLLLVLGCFFEPASAILVLAPLLLPTARSLGIDPLHLGIVFTVNLSIGMFTPPFGLNLFVAQAVLKKGLGEVAGSVLPFVVLYIVALVVVTYVPALATWLPATLMR